jgi:hypothetical protein
LSETKGIAERLDDLRLFDKRGITFHRGDVVKVFHFIGARRKRHYMYKQVLGFKMIGPTKSSPYFKFGHLNMPDDPEDHDGYYLEAPDGRVLSGYEIVQSIKCDHDMRARSAIGSDTGDKP